MSIRGVYCTIQVYCIESSDKLVLIHFDHLLTSCTRSGGTFNVQEFDQSGSLLRQRFPQKWISFMLAFTHTNSETEKRRFLDVVDIKEEYVKEDLRIQHYVIRRVSHLPVYNKTICSPY